MPQHREQFQITATLDDARRVVAGALGNLKAEVWQRPDPGSARLECKESWNLLSFHNPATVQVTLTASGSAVGVTLDGSSPGFGPIQSGHLRDVVTELRARIEAAAEAGQLAAAPSRAQPPAAVSEPAAAAPDGGGEPRVFVSYRRDDSGHVTDRICDALAERLGQGAIFKDIDDIPLGVNFGRFIRDRIERCDVLLAIIGKEWLGAGAEPGTTRLDDPSDYVRIELEAAFQRRIPVIPVLIRDAPVPPAAALPDSLGELPDMNGIQIRRGHDFENDLARLAAHLERLLADA